MSERLLLFFRFVYGICMNVFGVVYFGGVGIPFASFSFWFVWDWDWLARGHGSFFVGGSHKIPLVFFFLLLYVDYDDEAAMYVRFDQGIAYFVYQRDCNLGPNLANNKNLDPSGSFHGAYL